MGSARQNIEARALSVSAKRMELRKELKIMKINLESAQEMKLPTAPFMEATLRLFKLILKDTL